MDEFTPEAADNNALAALATLEQFLEDDEWYPSQLDDRPIFRMTFAGDNGQFVCYAQIVMDLEIFLFYAMAPIKVEEDKRLEVAEFLTRANYGMRIGNFEMDFNDGEVRYKSSLDFEGVLLSYDLIKHAIYPAVLTMDRYMPGLMSVIYGQRTPAEAIQDVEGS